MLQICIHIGTDFSIYLDLTVHAKKSLQIIMRILKNEEYLDST